MEIGIDDSMVVEDVGGNRLTFAATPGMFTRYRPVTGDMMVVYEDGYRSISPRATFDTGYSRVQS